MIYPSPAQILTTPIREWLPHWWYPAYLPEMPDLFVISIPPNIAAPKLPPGNRYYVYVSETAEDRRFFESGLDTTATLVRGALTFPFAKSKERKSRLPASDCMMMLYVPPRGAINPWTGTPLPHITMTKLPWSMQPLNELLRGRYGYDLHADEAAAMALISRCATTAALAGVPHGFVGPDSVPKHS